MLIGYVRVSTDDQNLNLQKDALLKFSVDSRDIFEDKTSDEKDKRVGLDKAIKFLKDGDTLVVWKLDKLGIRGGRPRAIDDEKLNTIKKLLLRG